MEQENARRYAAESERRDKDNERGGKKDELLMNMMTRMTETLQAMANNDKHHASDAS